jgi:hypothetical protein
MTGNRLVRLIHPLHKDCERLLGTNRDRKIVRRHALKLRYWPEFNPTTEAGQLLDLDWSWIKACPGMNIGELRINERLSGFDNWRVIFFDGLKPKDGGIRKLWILQLMKKKSNDFSDAEIRTFRLRRMLVVQRYYEGSI